MKNNDIHELIRCIQYFQINNILYNHSSANFPGETGKPQSHESVRKRLDKDSSVLVYNKLMHEYEYMRKATPLSIYDAGGIILALLLSQAILLLISHIPFSLVSLVTLSLSDFIFFA